MGFLDSLLGRTKPARPNLEDLFGLPSAAVTLEASLGLVPTGRAGMCFKPPAGQPFEQTQEEIRELLATGSDKPRSLDLSDDSFGYRWLVLVDPDLSELVTQVHVASSTLEEHGYGPQLLCSVFGFSPHSQGQGSSPAYLVYLYKRGTFYPFCPTGADRRDNQAELQLKAVLDEDLKMEPELSRWFPLWGLPV